MREPRIDMSGCPDPVSRAVTGPRIAPGDLIVSSRDHGEALHYGYADMSWTYRSARDGREVKVAVELIDAVAWRS